MNLVELTQNLIRNKCINTGEKDSGFETRSCNTLGEFFSGYGLQGQVIEEIPGRGNFLLRIPGKNPKAPKLMYMGHLDVVPARAEDWSVPPFEGRIQDQYLWGRGAVDMLSVTAAMAYGIAEYYKEKGPWEGDLLYLAVADEEASGRYGAQFLTRDHWDKVAADYLISELGGYFIHPPGGSAITLARGEKGILWTRIRTKGTAGHGSMPYRADNAAYKISRVLERLSRFDGNPQFHALYRQMVKGTAKNKWEEWLLTHKAGFERGLSRVFKRDPGWARFLHTAACISINPGFLQTGDKVNIIPDRGILELDIRIPPGQNKEEAVDLLKAILGPLSSEVDIEVFEYFPPNISSGEASLYGAIQRLAKKTFPNHKIQDMCIGGVTDGRYWRIKGSTVYGFSLFDEEMTMEAYCQRLHGKDEKISLASLEKAGKFFKDLPAFYSV